MDGSRNKPKKVNALLLKDGELPVGLAPECGAFQRYLDSVGDVWKRLIRADCSS